MPKESINYLNPNEQLVVAAKVNRFCEIDPEEFNPDLDVPEAHAIVSALDSRIKASGSFSFKTSNSRKSGGYISAGATHNGQFSTSFDSGEKKEKVISNIIEYRVGAYVATKRNKLGNQAIMIFEHFWGRGDDNLSFDRFPELTCIFYEKKGLDIQKVIRKVAVPRFFNMFDRNHVLVTYHNLPLWKK